MTPRPDDAPLDHELTSRLIRLGTESASTPMRRLLARLEEPDAPAWFARAAARPPMDRLLAADRRDFAPLSLPEFQEAKALAKSLAKSPAQSVASSRPASPHAPTHHEDDTHLATLSYFLVLAAARLRHGVWLTSEPPARVASELWDLATVLPESLADLVARAATLGEAE